MEKIKFLDINFSDVTEKEAMTYSINNFFCENGKKGNIVVTVNPEFAVKADEDEHFKKLLDEANLCIPDGIGIIYGSRYLNTPLKEKIGGFTYTMNVISYLNKVKGSVYLLGAAEGVVDIAANKLKTSYPDLIISGYRNGYFDESEEEAIVKTIASTNTDYLLVCLGIGKQEEFMVKYREKLNVKAMIGNGGAIDTIAGEVKRAPVIWQKISLEWLFRALDDKKRFKRLKTMLPKYFRLLRRYKKQ